MDKFFEFELEVITDNPAMGEALVEMIELVGELASKYRVCPTCLTYHFADAISTLEDQGKLGHVDACEKETVQ